MNILEKIVAHKREEVARRKKARDLQELSKHPNNDRQALSLKASLLDASKTGIIAEFKRKSPSKGVINANADVALITKAYTLHGASGLSVLTDEQFFGGGDADFELARQNQIPLLRKEFIIDEYQLFESKAMGADVILLIAACLSPAEVKRFSAVAVNLGMEVLLELHGEEELDHICEDAALIGINNRNLKTFEVDIDRSLRMAEKIPAEKIRVAESGISSPEMILKFKSHGFHGFLMGENFMKDKDPTIAFAGFVNQLKAKAL
jgi:indole-3-glycerol phosphate synthase